MEKMLAVATAKLGLNHQALRFLHQKRGLGIKLANIGVEYESIIKKQVYYCSLSLNHCTVIAGDFG
jgi:hypothetical protein